jgi:8-oxo-dGTP pyrophosphatase MutT (NUDIX family)
LNLKYYQKAENIPYIDFVELNNKNYDGIYLHNEGEIIIFNINKLPNGNRIDSWFAKGGKIEAKISLPSDPKEYPKTLGGIAKLFASQIEKWLKANGHGVILSRSKNNPTTYFLYFKESEAYVEVNTIGDKYDVNLFIEAYDNGKLLIEKAEFKVDHLGWYADGTNQIRRGEVIATDESISTFLNSIDFSNINQEYLYFDELLKIVRSSLLSQGIDFEVEKSAVSKSTYFSFRLNNRRYKIRVSDHGLPEKYFYHQNKDRYSADWSFTAPMTTEELKEELTELEQFINKAKSYAKGGKVNDNQKIATSIIAICNEKNEILVLQRGSTAPWMPNKWSLVGGVVDEGENASSAVVRESYEEVGLKIKNPKFVGTKYDKEIGFLHYFYVQHKHTRRIKLDYENQDYAWVGKNNYKNYDYVPYVQSFIEKVLGLK